MNCPNIIILTQPEADPEAESVKLLLKTRYGDRKTHEIQFDVLSTTGMPFVPQPRDLQPAEGKPETGIYVIVHCVQGIGMMLPLVCEADNFASWFVELTAQKFRIRKVCFISCAGVAMEEETPRPIPHGDEANTYVQSICYAISKLDDVGKQQLNGLMIAGYSSGVYLHASVSGRRPGAKLTQRSDTKHVMHPDTKIATDLTKKLKSYAQRKIVYVFQGEVWRLGNLWEYTDNAELRGALADRLKQGQS